jgi:hypothetical protein
VGSVVRSNTRGKIGFLHEPERVNVFLSRARDGMIIFGNADCLTQGKRGKEVWGPIVNYLTEQKLIFTGLPIVCQNHKNPNIIQFPNEFDEKCPEGGCSQVCGIINEGCLKGHPCQLRCHRYSNPHVISRCLVDIQVPCERNLHMVIKKCSDIRAPPCKTKVTVACERGLHVVEMQCYSKITRKCTQTIHGECSAGHTVKHKCSDEKKVIDTNCNVCKKLKDPFVLEEFDTSIERIE